MPGDAILKINGQDYGGWKSVQITRGIEQLAGTFNLSVSDSYPDNIDARPIQDGDECRVLIDGKTVITGYVDAVLPSFDANQHEIAIQGRDRTADLIDCSAQFKTGEWKNRTLTQIATDLCRPYGVPVKAETDVGAVFKKFKLQESESVFEALDRAARMRGVLLLSDGDGGLLITRAGNERITYYIEEGKNILAASGTLDQRDRFQTYIVKGQTAGSDFTTGTDHSANQYTVQDKRVGRHRTLIILAEDQADTGACKQRATWERNVRVGRSRRATVTVQDWIHPNGLWQPNHLVPVRSPWLGVDKALLIVSVTFTLDSNGTRTELALAPKQAFDVLPLPEPKEGDIW